MKTQSAKGKKNTRKKDSTPKGKGSDDSSQKQSQKKKASQTPVRAVQKRTVDKKARAGGSISKYLGMTGQFLRESRNELKKVKWPTRKELLASTAVVIVLTLLVAFYLGLVDFGLIKIIKGVLG